MVKQYDIVHATGYTYDTVVHQSYNCLLYTSDAADEL